MTRRTPPEASRVSSQQLHRLLSLASFSCQCFVHHPVKISSWGSPYYHSAIDETGRCTRDAELLSFTPVTFNVGQGRFGIDAGCKLQLVESGLRAKAQHLIA